MDFDDRNQLLVEELRTLYPSGAIMEMETFHLFHLARTCFRQLKVAAAAQVLAQRNSDEMITPTEIALVESQACGPLLDALVATPLLNVVGTLLIFFLFSLIHVHSSQVSLGRM